MSTLSYFLRCYNGNISVESLPTGENAELLSGFVRWTPEITHPEDITPALIDVFKEEGDQFMATHCV